MLQPFWVLPMRSILGPMSKHIIDYCLIRPVILGMIFSIVLTYS